MKWVGDIDGWTHCVCKKKKKYPFRRYTFSSIYFIHPSIICIYMINSFRRSLFHPSTFDTYMLEKRSNQCGGFMFNVVPLLPPQPTFSVIQISVSMATFTLPKRRFTSFLCIILLLLIVIIYSLNLFFFKSIFTALRYKFNY